jgi:hypothetical protein
LRLYAYIVVEIGCKNTHFETFQYLIFVKAYRLEGKEQHCILNLYAYTKLTYMSISLCTSINLLGENDSLGGQLIKPPKPSRANAII